LETTYVHKANAVYMHVLFTADYHETHCRAHGSVCPTMSHIKLDNSKKTLTVVTYLQYVGKLIGALLAVGSSSEHIVTRPGLSYTQ